MVGPSVKTCSGFFQVLPGGRLQPGQEPHDHVLHLLLPRYSTGRPLSPHATPSAAWVTRSALSLSGKVQPSPSELLDRGSPAAGLDLYLNKANSWLSGKKDAAERLLKNSSKTDVKGFFGGLESKLRSSMAPKTE